MGSEICRRDGGKAVARYASLGVPAASAVELRREASAAQLRLSEVLAASGDSKAAMAAARAGLYGMMVRTSGPQIRGGEAAALDLRPRRLRPAVNAFAYPTYFLLLPMRALREQPSAALARNRFGLLSFHDRDHGDGGNDALAWIDRFKPRRAVITNMHVDMDYDTLRRELPENVEPAFDGMTLTI